MKYYIAIDIRIYIRRLSTRPILDLIRITNNVYIEEGIYIMSIHKLYLSSILYIYVYYDIDPYARNKHIPFFVYSVHGARYLLYTPCTADPKNYWPTSTSSVYFFYSIRTTLTDDHMLL